MYERFDVFFMTPQRRTGGTDMPEALVDARRISKHYHAPGLFSTRIFQKKSTYLRAVNKISLTLAKGETLGVVGETGCGKSTLGRLLLRLEKPTSGEVTFKGQLITRTPEKDLRPLRAHMQIIFQDPLASLNPRHSVGTILQYPLKLHFDMDRKARRNRVAALLDCVGLQPDYISRYPHQLSGGQNQRVSIARAGRGAGVHRSRRTGCRARRLRTGSNSQSTGKTQEKPVTYDAVHLARFIRRQLSE